MDATREAFEKWNNDHGNGRNERDDEGFYRDSYTFNSWIAWQAATCLASAPAQGVTLRCPKCKREDMRERLETDYPEAATVEIVCPDCDDGDFHEEFQLDASGKHITRDPAAPQSGQAPQAECDCVVGLSPHKRGPNCIGAAAPEARPWTVDGFKFPPLLVDSRLKNNEVAITGTDGRHYVYVVTPSGKWIPTGETLAAPQSGGKDADAMLREAREFINAKLGGLPASGGGDLLARLDAYLGQSNRNTDCECGLNQGCDPSNCPLNY